MHMPQCPVVDARSLQLLDRARRIGTPIDAGFRVQHPDGESILRIHMERAHQIILRMACLVTDAIDRGRLFPILHERDACHLFGRKNMHRLRQRDIRTPGFARVVISMHDKDLDPRLRRPIQLPAESHLRREAVMV